MAKSQTSQTIKFSDLETKIDQLTVGLQPYLCRALKEMPAANSKVIVDYVLAMQSEINPTIKHRKNLIFNIMHFSRFLKHKLFSEMTKEDVLSYLDSYRKTDEADPLHRWIGMSAVLKLASSNPAPVLTRTPAATVVESDRMTPLPSDHNDIIAEERAKKEHI